MYRSSSTVGIVYGARPPSSALWYTVLVRYSYNHNAGETRRPSRWAGRFPRLFWHPILTTDMGWSTSLIVLALAKEAEFLSLTFEPSSPPVLTCAPRNTLSLPCRPSERLSVEPAHESDTPGQLRQCICHNSLELMTTDAPKRNTAYDLEGFESRRGACMCTGQACATSCGAHYRPVCIRWTREPSAEHCAFQCRTHASCEAFELIEQANETWCTLERGPVVYVPAPCSNLMTSLHTRVCAKTVTKPSALIGPHSIAQRTTGRLRAAGRPPTA